jgi:hypothetical protein
VFGEQQESKERELCRGRREEQVLGRSEQRQQWDRDDAADEEAHREPRHDPWKQLLHLAHVEQPAGLPADEHEADLERDRERDEEDPRHPVTAGDEDRP